MAVLRRGIELLGLKSPLKLAEFKPALAVNPDKGGPLYPGAGFSAKAHIQIAVRNPQCIKGYFLPIAGP